LNRKEFYKYERELKMELLDENIILLDSMDSHKFAEVVFNDEAYKDEFEDIVPYDSVKDCIVNFVDFRQDKYLKMPYKRNCVSIHELEDDEYCKIKVVCGYII